MVEISLSGSGEGLGRVTGRGYSTPMTLRHTPSCLRLLGACREYIHKRAALSFTGSEPR
jgi:hypothetical protein